MIHIPASFEWLCQQNLLDVEMTFQRYLKSLIDEENKKIQDKYNTVYIESVNKTGIRVSTSTFLLNKEVKEFCEKLHEKRHPSYEQIIGKSRKGTIVAVRFIVIYLIKKQYGTRFSLDSIGSIFGGRDHSSILHAVKTIKEKISIKDDYIKELLPEIEEEYIKFMGNNII